ncbi:MAG: DUF1217 domain-containing protein [Thalassovita sp.]
MTFQPIVPAVGLVGWNFLNRTLETQNETFGKAPEILRDTEYFEKTIGSIETPQDLVNDRRLFRVALGAFGLQDDINSKALILKVLEEGSLDPGSLANRMADSRYLDMATAFGFDLGVPNTALPDFAADIVDSFRAQQFEIAVGDQNENFRLALFAQREIGDIVSGESSSETKWLKILGNAPMREVVQTALGLPSSFTQIDLERQVEELQDRAQRQLNIEDISELADPDVQDKIVERFLLRSQVQNLQSTSSTSIALMLLQGGV